MGSKLESKNLNSYFLKLYVDPLLRAKPHEKAYVALRSSQVLMVLFILEFGLIETLDNILHKPQ